MQLDLPGLVSNQFGDREAQAFLRRLINLKNPGQENRFLSDVRTAGERLAKMLDPTSDAEMIKQIKDGTQPLVTGRFPTKLRGPKFSDHLTKLNSGSHSQGERFVKRLIIEFSDLFDHGISDKATVFARIEKEVRSEAAAFAAAKTSNRMAEVEADAAGAAPAANPSPVMEPKHIQLMRRLRFGQFEFLKGIAGDYLLLRRTFSLESFRQPRRNKLLVTHMRLHAPERDGDPCYFVTTSRDSDLPDPRVEGFAFASGAGASMHVYCNGYVSPFNAGWIDSPESRSTILMTQNKPGRAVDAGGADLVGIRLGLGKNDNRRPRGYRVWCSRCTDEIGDFEQLIGSYALTKIADPLLSYPDLAQKRKEFYQAAKKAMQAGGSGAGPVGLQSNGIDDSPLVRNFQKVYRTRHARAELLPNDLNKLRDGNAAELENLRNAGATDLPKPHGGIVGFEFVFKWLSVKAFADYEMHEDPKYSDYLAELVAAKRAANPSP